MQRVSMILAAALVLPVGLGTPASVMAQGGVPQPDGFQYYWPGSCLQAIQRSNAFYWRARQDSLRYDPENDTVLTVSVDVVRECIVKVKEMTLAPRDYVPLASAYLAVGDDQTAAATVSRRLSFPDVQTSGARAWALADVVQAYLGATPARVDGAKVYLKLLDVLSGAEVAVGKVRAYRTLALYYWRVGDVPNMIKASDRLIAVGRDLNEHDRNEFGTLLFAGYRYLAEAEAVRTGDSVAPRAVMGKATADIGRLINVEQMIRNYTSMFGLYGARAKPIVANQWIGVAGDTVHPMAGKFNLVVFRPHRGNIPAIRRLAEKYRDRLNVVGVLGTIGFFRDLGPLTPQLEAQELRKYYVDELQMPWSLALSYTEFTKMPDGRRSAEATPNERAYKARTGATAILVDSQGIIRQVWMSWDKSYESRIDEAIVRLSGDSTK